MKGGVDGITDERWVAGVVFVRAGGAGSHLAFRSSGMLTAPVSPLRADLASEGGKIEVSLSQHTIP